MDNQLAKVLFSLLIVTTVASCLPSIEGEKGELTFKENNFTTFSSEQEKINSIAAYQQTVYPFLRSKTCIACHGETRETQPYFMIDNVEEAWENLVVSSKKVNLNDPETSRIYLRLKDDKHNCFDGDCNYAAEQLLEKIKEWATLSQSQLKENDVKTSQLSYGNSIISSAETGLGTLLLQAEQEEFFDEVMQGRFEVDLDGKASGSKYAITPTPPVNPTTVATRTATINKTGICDVISPANLNDPVNGPYRISEQDTHINTGTVTEEDSIPIKNGYRPFSVRYQALLVRPDKRMEYAKMLTGWSNGSATGISDIVDLDSFALKDGPFDTSDVELRSDRRDPGAIDISDLELDGNEYEYLAFKSLPHFVHRDVVFKPSPSNQYITYADNPGANFSDINGNQFPLHMLFAPPHYVSMTKQVLDNIEVGKFSTSALDFRKNVIFKLIYERLDQISSSSNSYAQIAGMDRTHFFNLYGDLKINIMACPSGVCTASSSVAEVTAGSDTGGVALTYANAKDILKVNSTGTGFVAGTAAELAQGKAFRRLDIYAHIYEPTTSRTYGDSFENVFYSFDGANFTEIAKINFPIQNTNRTLNLKALYSDSSDALSSDDNITNFQNTLYPVLRSAACVACHTNDPGRPQFTNVSPVAALAALQDNNLIRFDQPENSFRKVNRPTGQYMVHNCNGMNDNDNAALCPDIETAFIQGINAWKNANDQTQSTGNQKEYKILSAKERTPGMLEYKFQVTETGYYNIWTKVKSGNGVANTIALTVKDGNTPLNTYTGIKSPSASNISCVSYTLGNNDDWTWFTPGRSTELANLDALGDIKLDNNGNLRTISDSRRYWHLQPGKIYTLQIFERAVATKIDLIAIDRVKDHEDILDFQPDLRARDQNNISDYKRNVLSYDISSQLGLAAGSAHFKVEVKLAFNGQNYIFRNPRIVSPTTNVRVSDIKVYINGSTMFSDATWTKLNLVTGNDKVLTYAPLVTLAQNGEQFDKFHFSFGILKTSGEALSEFDPRGTAPVIIEGRQCQELELFMKTVKPILRNARLILKEEDGYMEYANNFPGDGRGSVDRPDFYQCMTCHDDTHPYFKMTTFDYPEILCAQALSRVDFDNYRDSLLVRGIDGSGVHPKLYFIERLQYAADFKSVVQYNPDNGTRILDGQIRNTVTGDDGDYFSKWYDTGYFATYTKADLGIDPVWGNNSTAKKDLARKFLGQIRRVDYVTIPDSIKLESYYEPFVHDQLIGEIMTEKDDILAGIFDDRRALSRYNTFIPTSASDTLGRRSYEVGLMKTGDIVQKDADGNKLYSSPYQRTEIVEQMETIKSDYRQVILNWIAAEHAAFKRQQQ